MVKYSRQRECILKDLQERKDHPTANMIYESVRREQPNISLGTVYRNLTFLVSEGQIVKISTGDGPDRFDGCVKPHVHFVCTRCSRVLDVESVPEIDIVKDIDSGIDGVVEGYELKLYGKCESCISK